MDDADYDNMSNDEIQLAWEVEKATAEGLFGPVPPLLDGLTRRMVDAHTNDPDDPQREYVAFESAIAWVYVYEKPSHHGDIGLFEIDISVDRENDGLPMTTDRARELAAMITAAADEMDRLVAAGVGARRL